MKTIPVRDVRNHYAQIMREVQQGETFTVTSDGNPIATISPYVAPDGPQTWVPAERVVGALAHLDLPADTAARLRADLDEHFDPDVEDPFDRYERMQAAEVQERRAP
ncbi:type II toxin-antitoxin system Phd/YefM family antitoxin [Kineococcus sp. SYSU DK006]|uniref:type II toxin-antitoxin system Phd/YefM family antitoxin n=1 Tax=Kineococcus sp. SYSU DK006 TaxID=3383127 RepID=UPI003D7E7161